MKTLKRLVWMVYCNLIVSVSSFIALKISRYTLMTSKCVNCIIIVDKRVMNAK